LTKPLWTTLAITALAATIAADGPGDNHPNAVRPIPPRGIQLSATQENKLRNGVEALGKDIDDLRIALLKRPRLLRLLPDIQIYEKAVRFALVQDEFFRPEEVADAERLLESGRERARALRKGLAPWNSATGPVVRGYVSRLDGSIQPYGLVIPDTYRPNTLHKFRLDVWFHGRGETLSEVNFLRERQRSRGEFTPADTLVLHPYGRFCNANRFAGEVDLFEALAAVREQYPIDDNRISVRGFSMGGAACWDFAVHHAGLWAAAAPGAGFSETADFLKVFQQESLRPTWYEQKLWHLYDATDYAVNLFQCPTVAYSGEIDRQKQAADLMARALHAEGITLTHIIGPHTAHAYETNAKQEVSRRIDAIVSRGRNPLPDRVRFTTWTLRYNRMLWVVVDGLDEHWKRARVDAQIQTPASIRATTRNVNALTFDMPAGSCPLDNTVAPKVVLDGQQVPAAPILSDRSWVAHFRKSDGHWRAVHAADDGQLRKRHGLQGPIDDAFMDSFVMVVPSGQPLHERMGRWANEEMQHALREWRRQFRGEARVKKDTEITDFDIANHNLVLWGDPRSNKVLARIMSALPVHWNAKSVALGERAFPAENHAPVLIYPNPLNPKRYVVLNSGFTYREYDYLNNARQTPKLPDFAVIDIDTPASSRWPGRVVDAGFFDERWQVPAERP